MAALKCSLLALTALLSSQLILCSANRAHVFSEFVEPWPIMDDDHVAPFKLLSPRPSPVPSPGSGEALPPIPTDGPGPNSVAPPRPFIDGSEPSPARRAPPSPKEENTAEPVPAMKNGAKESDVSMNCGSGCGGWGGPDCGGGVGCCMPPPPKKPYYCQPAACNAYPGCGVGAGAGPGFTIYMDDHFAAAVSSSGNEQKH